MQELKECAEALIERQDRLHLWRKKAWDRLAGQNISLEGEILPLAVCPQKSGQEKEPIEPNTLVFADGFFQGARLSAPIVATAMESAMSVYGAFLQPRWNRALAEESDSFALMNGVLQGGGAFLYVPPHTQWEAPIHILYRQRTPAMCFPRLQIFLGKGSSIKIIERTEGDAASSLSNVYIDLNLDAGASLRRCDMSHWHSSTRYFSSLRCSLKRDSFLESVSLSENALFSRHSIKAQLLEENSEALLRGLWTLDRERKAEMHVFVEHVAPSCRSRQHFKGVLRDRARSRFEGKIFVHPEAQKTEAYQINNNLSLSDEALAIAKPNLEIFADDVKASHGATIAQLNEEDLFYLRSRGIGEAEAKEMLVEGFCSEMAKYRFGS